MADVDFLGETFETSEKIGLMPLMRFAKVAQGGVDSASLEGLAAMYDLIEQCLAESEWERFQAHATRTRADQDDILAVVTKVIEVLSARPTSRPSDSSDGPSATSGNSEDASYSRALRALDGRPDLQVAVLRAKQARSA